MNWGTPRTREETIAAYAAAIEGRGWLARRLALAWLRTCAFLTWPLTEPLFALALRTRNLLWSRMAGDVIASFCWVAIRALEATRPRARGQA